MNFAAVQQVLNDLPNTFKRPGAPYTQVVDALTALLTLYTLGVDGIIAQLQFSNAQYGWVDTYGALFGITRRPNEADTVYKARFIYTLTTWRTNPVVMEQWLLNVEKIVATITENFPAVGYQIALPATLTTTQILQIIKNLAWVRPAGVPFSVGVQSGGTFLDTVNYIGHAPRVTGAYLGGGLINQPLGLGPNTNSTQSILPDLLMVDPTLNPGIVAS